MANNNLNEGKNIRVSGNHEILTKKSLRNHQHEISAHLNKQINE
jgi:hypothetical protein